MGEDAGEWGVGSLVEAQDSRGSWYTATVRFVRGEGTEREVKVSFKGWARKWDEWLTRARIIECGAEPPPHPEAGNAGHIEKDLFEVEKLVSKRKRKGTVEYRVHWKGYGTGDRTWEPASDITERAITEYEDAHFGDLGSGVPFTLARAEIEDPDHHVDRCINWWVLAVGRECSLVLSRQREEFAARKVFTMQVCPPTFFVALQRAMAALAHDCPGAKRHALIRAL